MIMDFEKIATALTTKLGKREGELTFLESTFKIENITNSGSHWIKNDNTFEQPNKICGDTPTVRKRNPVRTALSGERSLARPYLRYIAWPAMQRRCTKVLCRSLQNLPG